MTQFQTFKQNNYLPNLKHINNLISPKNQQHLQKLLSIDACTLLTTFINHTKTTMEIQPQKHQRFYETILLTNNFAKQTLNLTRRRLQKALYILDYFQLIQISYYYSKTTNHKTRTITLQLSNFKHFITLLNNFKKFTSNPTYCFMDFNVSLRKFDDAIYPCDEEELIDYEEEF